MYTPCPLVWSNMLDTSVIYAALTCSILSLCWFTQCSSIQQNKAGCPLWHILKESGKCDCGETYNDRVSWNKNYVSIIEGICLTWNNSTNRAELHSCLFSSLWDNKRIQCQNNNIPSYRVSVNTSGESLNKITCGGTGYNRQGAQCGQCLDHYGPAIFSDGVSCADCFKHKHIWILNLILQLLMVTFMCLLFIALQISAAASPYNIIMVYAQLTATALKFNGDLHINLNCLFGETFTKILITILDVWNLEFFRLINPPLCIGTSFKAINTLLFDYMIAIYPLIFSAFIYFCIELYDRNNRIIVFLSFPIRKCFISTWNPKKTILNTFTTFCLVSHSKFFFVSINLLSATEVYNSQGKAGSKVLLYDPTSSTFTPSIFHILYSRH